MRTPVFRVSDLVSHKLGCTATEEFQKLEISNSGSRGIVRNIFVVKTKALISCTVTSQLICAFVFAYAIRRFTHDTAHFVSPIKVLN